MINSLLSLPWFLAAAVVIGIIFFVSVSGLLIIHSLVNHKVLKDHHAVSGYIFTTIGVLYAVLISFTVVDVQDRYTELRRTAEGEAKIVLDLYRDAQVFPETNKLAIRKALHDYAENVVYQEWDLMSSGKLSPELIELQHEIWFAYYDIQTLTPKEEIWYGQSISQLNQFNDKRLLRIYNSKESLGSLMWALLIGGAFTTIASVYFFSVDSFVLKILMTLALSGLVGFMLFIILAMNHPFAGDMGIKPYAMQIALDMFSYWN